MTMTEKPKTSLPTVLSKVAAALNFWSGITVVFLVEIFEFFYRIFDTEKVKNAKQIQVYVRDDLCGPNSVQKA